MGIFTHVYPPGTASARLGPFRELRGVLDHVGDVLENVVGTDHDPDADTIPLDHSACPLEDEPGAWSSEETL
jgi:hypothetical protein